MPGMVGAILTVGQWVRFHPHIHALVTDGVCLPNGRLVDLGGETRPKSVAWDIDVGEY
jgi:hypothetical protein